MTASDLPLINQVLQKMRSEVAPDMSEPEFFELFAAQHILREYQVGADDIEVGLVGGDEEKNKTGSDGGIDGFYLLIDKQPINDVDAARALKSAKHKPLFDVVIIQASTETSFTMDRVLRLKDTSENIFNLHRTTFTEKYNEALADAIERFRTAHHALLLREPTLSVSFFYVTRGNSSTVAKDIRLKAEDFSASLKNKVLPTIEHCSFAFVGARELYQLFQKPPKTDYPLTALQVLPQGKRACVALIKLKDYFKLIRNREERRTSNSII